MVFLTNCFETSFYNASIYRLLIWLFWHFFKMLLAWDTSGLILFQLDLFETLLAWSIWHASVDFPLKMLLSWDASGSINLGMLLSRFIWDSFFFIWLETLLSWFHGDVSILVSWRCFNPEDASILISLRHFYLDFLETLLSKFPRDTSVKFLHDASV